MRQAYAPGGYDWLETWRRMYDEERDQAENATTPDFTRQADFWANQAGRFAAAAREAPQPDSFMHFLLPHLRPNDRLLDIGAGTGRYEPLLARTVAEVLAVEPSPSMRDQLERCIAAEQLVGVRVVPDGWPEADVPPCDVAISAHVLYSVREIAPFLERMNAITRRSCFLLLAYRHPLSFMSAFWERFHGAPRKPLPGALECLNALYQLGIMAHLTLITSPSGFSYTNEHEALADIRWRLRFPADAERDRAIIAAIGQLLDRGADGSLTPRDLPQHRAVIWWEHHAEE